MRYIAYQIVDFNNPISVKYSEYSRKSFEPVSDLIKIIPVQCYVPNTLPLEISWNNKKRRTESQKAVIASHYRLAVKAAQGEDFIVMEHDAYLWPDRVRYFRRLLDYAELPVWNIGIAVECYKMNYIVAQQFCEIVENDFIYKHVGPMGMLHAATNMVQESRPDTRIVWPVFDSKNNTCLAYSIKEAQSGKGRVLPAPVTQHVSERVGVTIKRRTTPNKTDNPNVHFIDI